MRALTTSLLLSSALFLAACSSTSLEKPTIEDHSGKGTATGNREVKPIEANDADMTTPKELLAKSSIFFDYDSYVVKPEGQAAVEAHAKYLSSHKNRKVVIQGNTDERGGREYNLALGQKRAEAVRKSLSLLGVPDSQMEAVSFGKEKPRAQGHDEAAWAENRRADLVYPQ
jgi:peptidoglycan-associated lipoprotein